MADLVDLPQNDVSFVEDKGFATPRSEFVRFVELLNTMPPEVLANIFQKLWDLSPVETSSGTLLSSVGWSIDPSTGWTEFEGRIQGNEFSPYIKDPIMDMIIPDTEWHRAVTVATVPQLMSAQETGLVAKRHYSQIQLKWPMYLRQYARLSLNALTVFLHGRAARKGETSDVLYQQLDNTDIDYAKFRQPSRLPLPTALTSMPLHFLCPDTTKAFFHQDRDRVYTIKHFSYDAHESAQDSTFNPLLYQFWAKSTEKIFLVVWSYSASLAESGKLLPYLVRLDDPFEGYLRGDASPEERHPFPGMTIYQIPLTTFNIGDDRSPRKMLQTLRDHATIVSNPKWPPYYVEYREDMQNSRTEEHAAKLEKIGLTLHVCDAPGVFRLWNDAGYQRVKLLSNPAGSKGIK
ncbi:hypothetical protein KCU92_g10165, partial [Aureobasidium melanogenum]